MEVEGKVVVDENKLGKLDKELSRWWGCGECWLYETSIVAIMISGERRAGSDWIMSRKWLKENMSNKTVTATENLYTLQLSN